MCRPPGFGSMASQTQEQRPHLDCVAGLLEHLARAGLDHRLAGVDPAARDEPVGVAALLVADQEHLAVAPDEDCRPGSGWRARSPRIIGPVRRRARPTLHLDSNIRSLVVSSPWNIRSVQEHDPGQPRPQPLRPPVRSSQPSGAARPRGGHCGRRARRRRRCRLCRLSNHQHAGGRPLRRDPLGHRRGALPRHQHRAVDLRHRGGEPPRAARRSGRARP